MTAQEYTTLLLLLSLAQNKLMGATSNERVFLIRLVEDTQNIVDKYNRAQRNKELKQTSWSGW
jgi:hypothetical protein